MASKNNLPIYKCFRFSALLYLTWWLITITTATRMSSTTSRTGAIASATIPSSSPWADNGVTFYDPSELLLNMAPLKSYNSNSNSNNYDINSKDGDKDNDDKILVFIHSVVGVFPMKRKVGSWGYGHDILMELLQSMTLTDTYVEPAGSIIGGSSSSSSSSSNSKSLMSLVDVVFISLLGTAADIANCLSTIDSRQYNESGKLRILLTAPNIFLSELPTIYALDVVAKHVGKSSKILYIHTKGVRKNGLSEDYPGDWRKYMMYFLISNHQLCMLAMNRYNYASCGVLKQKKIYAGNFWWVQAGFIQNRSNSVDYKPLSEMAWNMDNRYEAEEYLFKYSTISEVRSSHFCIHHTHHDMQNCPTPRRFYDKTAYNSTSSIDYRDHETFFLNLTEGDERRGRSSRPNCFSVSKMPKNRSKDPKTWCHWDMLPDISDI